MYSIFGNASRCKAVEKHEYRRYQSYRTHDVPEWNGHCAETIRSWASSCGYDCYFYDDRFFDLLPTWFGECFADRILPVTDLARLTAAQSLFAK
jgi:hypothetical protein